MVKRTEHRGIVTDVDVDKASLVSTAHGGNLVLALAFGQFAFLIRNSRDIFSPVFRWGPSFGASLAESIASF